MESNVGIVRDAGRLTTALARLQEIRALLPPPSTRHRAETRNIVESGLAIARCALARTESRGGHYRSDYPRKDDAHFRKHSVLTGDAVRFNKSAAAGHGATDRGRATRQCGPLGESASGCYDDEVPNLNYPGLWGYSSAGRAHRSQ